MCSKEQNHHFLENCPFLAVKIEVAAIRDTISPFFAHYKFLHLRAHRRNPAMLSCIWR